MQLPPPLPAGQSESKANYMERIGTTHEFQLGRIGRSGSKIHIVSCDVYRHPNYPGQEIVVNAQSICVYSNRGGKPISTFKGPNRYNTKLITCELCLQRTDIIKLMKSYSQNQAKEVRNPRNDIIHTYNYLAAALGDKHVWIDDLVKIIPNAFTELVKMDKDGSAILIPGRKIPARETYVSNGRRYSKVVIG